MRSAEQPKQNYPHNPARRHFMHVLGAAVAGSAAVFALPTHVNAGNDKGNQSDNGNGKGKGNGGPACFLRGTGILTDVGYVKIECLSIGDRVVTVDGAAASVKWIGRRTFTRGNANGWPDAVHPIRIARSALADNVPHANLYLSPGHSLLIDGNLIPVMHLVNGTSISRVIPAGVTDIEYFQVELATHEAIFAEGAPVETFLPTEGREVFSNFAEYDRLYGRDEQMPMAPYAPLLHYAGGRYHLKALLRSGISHLVDIRDPLQIAYERVAGRAIEHSL